MTFFANHTDARDRDERPDVCSRDERSVETI